MPKCNKCGKSFDSEKGVKIHKSQVHEKDSEKASEVKTIKNLEVKSVKPWLLAGVIIILGAALILVSGAEGEIEEDSEVDESFSRDLKLVVDENVTDDDVEEGDNHSEG